ncbi:MICAL-like protein 1 [Narcine bancroftii]|uniref:MICAL-like protein 1 n=1 Tax=Narcine bancroftii TaxID=1343680 RepID=UPI0038313C68
MATRALQEWARRQADGYPGVDVRNMTSSFRDGLAFCAIIHRHRPDLIDFDSLSKENVFENNHLAFEVAEKELGIPALLDAEDMVAMRVPDRLSILTYVSQLYNYFTNQTHAGVPPSMKRPAAISPSEPSVKKVVTVNKQVLTPHSEFTTEERTLRNTLSSTCAICSKHVHLVQRYLVDGKLYHRNCFRCKECSSTLLPGAYKPGAHSGTFVCTHHRGRGTGQLQQPLSGQSLPSSLPARTHPSTSPRTPCRSWAPSEASQGRNLSPLLGTGLNAEDGSKQPGSTESGLSPSVPSEFPNSRDFTEISKPRTESPIAGETQRSTDNSSHKNQTENGTSTQLEPGTPSDLLSSQTEQQQAVVMETDPTAERTSTSESPGPNPDARQTAVNKEALEEKLRTLPVPVPRKTVDSASSPVATPRPVPRPRVSYGSGVHETSAQRSESNVLANGGVTEQPTPVPKPRDRPQTLTERSTPECRKGDVKPKDPPWLSLVNSELKRRPAPPRPGTRPSPSSGQRETAEARFLNPFEVDEEEMGEASERPQELALTESTPRTSHPWYGIQLAPSPRSKRRPAPPAPNVSPSVHCSAQSLDPKTGPSPSLSMESITENSAKSTPELHRRFEDGPTLAGKSPEVPSEGPVITGGSPKWASRSPADTTPSPEVTSESPALTDAVSEAAIRSPATKEATAAPTETPASFSHHRPPPKPPSTHSPVLSPHPSPESNRLKATIADLQPKSSCKENPFDRKSSPVGGAAPLRPRKGPKPARPPAPGHGFPLIKRKVHANQYIPEESIQGELEQLEQELDELELRGVALEEKLRNCENDDDEDDLLVDWFKLIHEKHLLVRRESELVYTFKQQNLEERQADVEYELRCLLNKPEKDWTDEDRTREQELMQELITVIEQRNAIINSLDEDRQREEEEDKMLETMIKNKEFHKDPNSEMKKKAKFKASKMLKFLSNKPEGKAKNGKEKNL